MKLKINRFALLALALVPVAAHAQAVAGSWNSSWSDEFNGGQNDLNGWNYDLGNGGPDLPGWGNNELEWVKGQGGNPGTLSWFVDGVMYSSFNGGWDIPGGGGPDAPFDKPFYIIMNMAVGGNYVGNPNLTPGAYDMQVDYVRSYTAAVPEPCSLLVLGLGALAGLKRRARARS